VKEQKEEQHSEDHFFTHHDFHSKSVGLLLHLIDFLLFDFFFLLLGLLLVGLAVKCEKKRDELIFEIEREIEGKWVHSGVLGTDHSLHLSELASLLGLSLQRETTRREEEKRKRKKKEMKEMKEKEMKEKEMKEKEMEEKKWKD